MDMTHRLAQSAACSCSYPTARAAAPAAGQRRHPAISSDRTQLSRRLQQQERCAAGQRIVRTAAGSTSTSSRQEQPSENPKQQKVSGYTPANFVSFSDSPEHRCHHLLGIEVNAPASLCFSIWNDWNRLVEFLDLISQIGLDPNQNDFALFQCFYRWGMLPVLEIVFLLQKTHVEQDKLIQFETVQGLPASGEVQFLEQDGKTTVLFKFEHQLPNLLVDLQVDVFGMETSCREIFTDNLALFKEIAEAQARDPSQVPPRQEAEDEPIEIGVDMEEEEEEEGQGGEGEGQDEGQEGVGEQEEGAWDGGEGESDEEGEGVDAEVLSPDNDVQQQLQPARRRRPPATTSSASADTEAAEASGAGVAAGAAAGVSVVAAALKRKRATKVTDAQEAAPEPAPAAAKAASKGRGRSKAAVAEVEEPEPAAAAPKARTKTKGKAAAKGAAR